MRKTKRFRLSRKKKPARAALEARKNSAKQHLVKQSEVIKLAALPAMKVRRIKIADIVVKNPRELNPAASLPRPIPWRRSG